MSSSQKADLVVDWCSHQAAKYACQHWHYSESIPIGRLVKLGVWEDGAFIGCVIFGDGLLGRTKSYCGIDKMQVAECVRIALDTHIAPVSKILSIGMRKLRELSPNLRLLVSFADLHMNHHGGIYQATNWIYTGLTEPTGLYKHKRTGKIYHQKNVTASGWTTKFGRHYRCAKPDEVVLVRSSRKHRYLYPLDRAMRRRIQPLAKPYPKRRVDQDES